MVEHASLDARIPALNVLLLFEYAMSADLLCIFSIYTPAADLTYTA